MAGIKKMYAVKYLFNGRTHLNFFFVNSPTLSLESAWALACAEYDVPLADDQSLMDAAKAMGISGVKILPEV